MSRGSMIHRKTMQVFSRKKEKMKNGARLDE
jgi:hypothetical protein